MKRYEVRCCCEPEKLRGWIDVEGDQRSYKFNLRPEFSASVFDAIPSAVTLDSLIMDMALINPGNGGRDYFALKAEGIPPEKLRRIPGFIPAT